MKKSILYLTDYIEGRPVVASVRYAELMKVMSNKFNIVVCNNYNFGEQDTQFSSRNFKFHTFQKDITSSSPTFKESDKGKWKSLLRNQFILKLWRNLKLSKTIFFKKNQALLKDLEYYVDHNKIDFILVTVPDIYVLYIMDYLKKQYPTIPVVVEIRDILNHSIGKGNPRTAYIRAENLIIKHANQIIALSEGIKLYYEKVNQKKNTEIHLIRNGYSTENFSDCNYNRNIYLKSEIVLSHVGSIYKGRNVRDLIKALEIFSERSGKKIVFNIVGVIDNEAIADINAEKINRVKLNILGTKSHEEAIEILKNSDIAVILTHKSGSDYAIPGKTFEYIGACKPILAITEDRELIRLVEPNYGEAACHQVDSIVKKLFQLVSKNYDFSDRSKFSRVHQAEKISFCLENIINQSNQSRVD